jgi:GT2 family glycosyltransferase
LGHDDLDAGQYDVSRQVIAGCGAATLVRRSAFDEVAGLDEDFFAYVDDIDLGLRLHLRGYRGIYVPSAVGFHIGSATLGADTLHPKIAEWLTCNQILLLVKDYPAFVFIKLAPRILVFQLLWLIFTLARGRAASYVRGVWRALRLLPRMLRKRRQIMRQRRVTAEEFLNLLLSSEEQVFDWHRSQAPSAKSRLLKIYFGFFRR